MLLLDSDRLQHARSRVADNGTVQRALESLHSEVAVLKQRPPLTVLDKELTPPSGDKHDYYSFGPYWWPAPNTPDGLPYIRRDGEVNPDVERTDFATFRQMMRDVETLTLFGFYTRDESASEAAARQLRAWFLDDATRMNPHLEYAQAIPGICNGRGIGIIDTTPLCLLPDIMELLCDSASWSAEDNEALDSWLGEYLDWLLTSEHGKDESQEHNNHGTWYDAQVAALALAAHRLDDACEVLVNAPERRFASHIAADGSQPHELTRTRSFSYSCFNLEAMFHLAALGGQVDLDLWNWRGDNGASLQKALEFLAPYADPQREWPYPQIVPLDRSTLLSLQRRATTARFGRTPIAVTNSTERIPNFESPARVELLWPA